MTLSRNSNVLGNKLMQFKYGPTAINNHRKQQQFSGGGTGTEILAWDALASTYTLTGANVGTAYVNIGANATALESASPLLKMVASPRFGALSEVMTGNSGATITATGQFLYSAAWDSNAALGTIEGLHPDLDGKHFLGLTYYCTATTNITARSTTNGYVGTVLWAFTNPIYNSLDMVFRNEAASNFKSMRVAIVSNGAVTVLPNTSGWNFSNNQQSLTNGTRGYNLTTRFSADDGTWGVNTAGTLNVDGNSPGPTMNAAYNSYGFINYNAADSSAVSSGMYWGGQFATPVTPLAYVFTSFA